MLPSFNLRHFFAAILILACAAGTTAVHAQRRKRPDTPRAIAIVELKSESDGGNARLVPITIKIGERYHNAGIYMASPVPLALERGNIYEVFKAGSLIGHIKLEGTRRNGQQWSGLGKWTPLGKLTPKAEEKPGPIVVGDEDDERPKLRRPGGDKSAAAETPAAAPVEAEEEDPDRPRLRRGRPQPSSDDEVIEQPSTGPVITLVAISDPGEFDRLTFSFPLNPGEGEQLSNRMAALAMTEVDKHRAARKQRELKKADIKDVSFRALDVDTDNASELIFSGRVPQAGGADYLVTVVARVDYEGTPRRLFGYVTDVKHREVSPPLEFIDAVDADADGRGDLLFRQSSASENTYLLYRAGIDSLELLYEGSTAK